MKVNINIKSKIKQINQIIMNKKTLKMIRKLIIYLSIYEIYFDKNYHSTIDFILNNEFIK